MTCRECGDNVRLADYVRSTRDAMIKHILCYACSYEICARCGEHLSTHVAQTGIGYKCLFDATLFRSYAMQSEKG